MHTDIGTSELIAADPDGCAALTSLVMNLAPRISTEADAAGPGFEHSVCVSPRLAPGAFSHFASSARKWPASHSGTVGTPDCGVSTTAQRICSQRGPVVMWRGIVPVGRLLLLMVLGASLVLGSCARTTSARDVFGDEPLMSESFPGFVEVSQTWMDGKPPGGVTGKSIQASGARILEAEPGTRGEAGFAELTEAATKTGWVEATPTTAPSLFFTADKDFSEGPGHLIIGVVPGSSPVRLSVSVVLNDRIPRGS